MYYHISKKYLGESIVLKPKIPSTAHSDEGALKRVCFCPTINQCLRAIESSSDCFITGVIGEFLPRISKSDAIQNPSVYVTQSNLIESPKSVSDFSVTDEHWSLTPIAVELKCFLDLRSIMLGSGKIHTTQNRYSIITKEEHRMWMQARKLSKLKLEVLSVNQ